MNDLTFFCLLEPVHLSHLFISLENHENHDHRDQKSELAHKTFPEDQEQQ